MVDCIPILQTEKKILGMVYECVWNTEAITWIIIGFFLLIFLSLIPTIIKAKKQSPSSKKNKLSNRKLLNISSKHKEKIYNLVYDMFNGWKILDSKKYSFLKFESESFPQPRIFTDFTLEEHNNKLLFVMNRFRSKWQRGMFFRTNEVAEFDRLFDKVIEDINNLVKKQ